MKGIKDINDILVEIKKYLVANYKAGIKKLILYGSFARGEATDDSDVDILVVVDANLNPISIEEYLSDYLFEILLENDELISVIALDEDLYNNSNSSLLLNVKEEGIEI